MSFIEFFSNPITFFVLISIGFILLFFTNPGKK